MYIGDAIQALERAKKAWNPAQFSDALNSAELFIALAKAEITTKL